MVGVLEALKILKIKRIYVAKISGFEDQKCAVLHDRIHFSEVQNWVKEMTDNITMINNIKFFALKNR